MSLARKGSQLSVELIKLKIYKNLTRDGLYSILEQIYDFFNQEPNDAAKLGILKKQVEDQMPYMEKVYLETNKVKRLDPEVKQKMRFIRSKL